MQNSNLTANVSGGQGSVILNEFAIPPGMTLSNAPIELLTFSFTGDVLFYIRLRAKGDFESLKNLIQLDDNLIKNASLSKDGTMFLSGLKILNNSDLSPVVAPNPFHEIVNIQFNLPSAMTVELSIFDSSGRLLLQQKRGLGEGFNSWKLDAKDIPSTGLLIYHLRTKDYFYSGKIIKLN